MHRPITPGCTLCTHYVDSQHTRLHRSYTHSPHEQRIYPSAAALSIVNTSGACVRATATATAATAASATGTAGVATAT
eukprot:gene108-3500_t